MYEIGDIIQSLTTGNYYEITNVKGSYFFDFEGICDCNLNPLSNRYISFYNFDISYMQLWMRKCTLKEIHKVKLFRGGNIFTSNYNV